MTRPHNTTVSRTWPRRLTQAAFFIALALVIARGTMLEILRDPFDVSPGSAPVPRGLTAGGAVVLDWLACLPALLVFARIAFDRSFRLVRIRSHLAIGLLALWAALSPLWSNDRYAAVVGVSHFIGGFAILWAMSQLVRDHLRLRFVASVCFGLLLVLIGYGLIYRWVELPDLQRSVEKSWTQILTERGWQADSFIAKQFHQKVMAGEMVGFTASPNSLAAVLVMLSIVSAGVVIQRLTDRDAAGWAILVALPLPLAAVVIWYTQSRAAFVTPILGAICIAFIALARPILARHRAIFFSITLAGIVIVAAALVGYGLRHNNLIQDSLTFRWKYWIGSSRLVAQHPIQGVGWNNFGDQYLAIREPEASEEIKDPHNLLVRMTAELGSVGAILLLTWLLMLGWDLTRPTQRSEPPIIQPHGNPSAALSTVLWLSVVAIAINVFFSLDFTQDAAWLFIELLKRMLFGLLLVIGLIVVSFRAFDRQELDDRAAPWELTASLVALGIFLLHNMIDFSLFETGPMWIFMMLCGAALGLGTQLTDADAAGDQPAKRFGAKLATATLGIAWLASGIVIVLPLVTAESKADAADQAIRANQPAQAAQLFLDAYEALPFSNTDYLYRASRAQIVSQAPADVVRQTLERAIAANPTVIGYYLRLAEFEFQQPQPDIDRACKAFDRAISLNPNDVQSRLDYAAALEQFGKPNDAAGQYREALQKNDGLDRNEPKRLTPEKVLEIRRKISSLE